MYESMESAPIAERITSSRIEMLIAIYDAAIDAIDRVEELLENGEEDKAVLATSQAAILIGLIESGLDLSQGEIPEKIRDLCEFVQASLIASTPAEIQAAGRVLRNLRAGFVGIKSEATALESRGEIPRVPTSSVDTLV